MLILLFFLDINFFISKRVCACTYIEAKKNICFYLVVCLKIVYIYKKQTERKQTKHSKT